MEKWEMTKMPGFPDDVWQDAEKAMAGTGWYAKSRILGAARAIVSERERCAKLLEEGYDRAVATPYRNDGVRSKNDQCAHGRYMYEDCEPCAAIAIRAA